MSTNWGDIGGRWTGSMDGTNRGGVTVDVTQDGQKVVGTAIFLEREYGGYKYTVHGAIGSILKDGTANVQLRLTPESSDQLLNLGVVSAAGVLNRTADSFEGKWSSTIGTTGTFVLGRRKADPTKSEVFIVHGHDEGSKERVARLIEKLGLKPVILHEQADRGMTIIEKFESHANQVGFAVVLLTPDDVGAAKAAMDLLKPRARQNVILEMGYFIAKLGRAAVCPLYLPSVEMPSDLFGVLYVPMDEHGGWEVKLARELAAAGLVVDLNRLTK